MLLLRTSARVLMISPVGVTTTSDLMFSLDVPYFNVLNPLPPVDAIPPMLGLLLGSGPKQNPYGASALFNSFFSTPAPTFATPSPGNTSIFFINRVSNTIPPEYATHPPSSPVPAPLGTTITFRLAHARTTAAVSSASLGNTNASGVAPRCTPISSLTSLRDSPSVRTRLASFEHAAINSRTMSA